MQSRETYDEKELARSRRREEAIKTNPTALAKKNERSRELVELKRQDPVQDAERKKKNAEKAKRHRDREAAKVKAAKTGQPATFDPSFAMQKRGRKRQVDE